MKLQDLYTAILESLYHRVDPQGMISTVIDDVAMPTMLGELRLAIPTDTLLRRGDWTNYGLQPFHPMSEHLARGESPVLRKLRMMVQLRLTEVYQRALVLLTDLCADPKTHKKIAPRGAAVLSVMPEADAKSAEAIRKIIDNAIESGPGGLVKVFLRRGVVFDGVKASRVCVIRFPLLEEFEGDDPTVLGVKLRKKDYVGFRKLLEYVTPDADEIETYGAASTSSAAPFFDALMHAFVKTAERLNSVIYLYRKHIDDEDELLIDLTWKDGIENLDQYRDVIPPLSGNEGEVATEESAGVKQGAVVHDAPSTRTVRALPAQPAPSVRDVDVDDRVDAVSRALRQPSPVPQLNIAEATREPAPKTFAEMQAERARSLGQPVPSPYPQQMMPMPAAPGTYSGYNRGVPVNTGYAAVPPQGHYAMGMPTGGGYPPNTGYPGTYNNGYGMVNQGMPNQVPI